MTAPNSLLLRNRMIVLLIFLISVVPFGLAWYLAKNPQLLEDRKKSNYGHLITPPRTSDYAELSQTPLGAAENLPEAKGHWIMLQIEEGAACSRLCRETAQKTGQIRLMLNKEISRVRRLLLVAGPADAAAAEELARQDPTLLMAGLSPALRQKLQEATGVALTEGMVILLDPQANLMMWYESGFDPYGLLRDLQRLLRISQIG